MILIFILSLLSCLCRRSDSVIFILCRNEEKDDIKKTLENFEDKFNKRYHYPYVFLNDKDWSEDFKKVLTKTVSGDITFGKLDPSEWDPPKSIDMSKAKANWKKMVEQHVPYADRLSYHNMCRFFSRKFYSHPSVQKYKYYWRIEPGVQFRNKIDYDPFEYMDKHKLLYGFTITLHEFMSSIPTLWDVTSEFLKTNRDLLPKNITPLKFMFENGQYNGCHFWSNFEIASFEFFRSEIYNKYVDTLESKGGFYYERWGDAPVHSFAAALFIDRSKVHFFDDIGYTHPPYTHCPKGCPGNVAECDCTEKDNFDNKPGSCLGKYFGDIGMESK